MLRYELCKLFARPSGKAALLLLAVLVAVSTFFACHVRYTDEEGQTQYGLSAVLPFAVIFLPALLLGDINTLLSNILGLLPDKLLQINRDLAYFDLYQLGDSVMGAIPILLVLYTVLTLLFIPLLYKTYQHKQLK